MYEELFEGKIAVFAAHQAVQRKADASFPFEQESNFFWLTNIEEPDWFLIIDGVKNKSFLVSPEIPDHQQLFDGSLDHVEARRKSGINEIITLEESRQMLKSLAPEHATVYALAAHPHEPYFGFAVNPAQPALWSRLEADFKNVVDCRALIAKARAIKSADEIEKIREAVQHTVATFTSLKNKLPSLQYEYEIEAELSYGFRYNGAQGHAYDPIVAGGAHACTLHYGKNSEALPGHGLVLIDAGAKVDGYAADVTRTYALGSPSEREVAVHAAVEAAHKDIIELLGPGVSVKEYHEKVDIRMKEALRQLDLLTTDDDYRKYFPHAISHGLGIDVHDSLGSPEVFVAGMVLTVEPGIYIPEEGIGVRIEDDILITETGFENLSAALPTGL